MGQYQQWLHYRDIDRLLHTQLEELEEELAQLQIREQLLQQILQLPIEDATPLLQSDNEILHALAIGLNGHTEPMEHTQGYTQSANGATEVSYNGTVGTAILSGHPVRTLSGGDTLSGGQVIMTGNEVIIAPPCPDPLAETRSSQSDEPMAAISSAPIARNGLPPADEQYVTNPDPDSLQPPHSLLNSNLTLPPGSHSPNNPNSPNSPNSPHYEPMLLPEDMDAFIDGHSETEPRMELPTWLRNAALHNANGPIDQESMRTNRLIQRWIERWGRHQELQPDEHELHREDTSL